MKITKRMLKQIIKEELQSVLAEQTAAEKLALDSATQRARDADPGWTGRAAAQIDKALTNVGQTGRRAKRDISDWAESTVDSFRAAKEVMPGGGGMRAALRHKKEVIHQEILDYLAFEASKSAAGMAGALVEVLPGDWDEEQKELETYVRQSITRASPDMAEWITSGIVGEEPTPHNCPPCPVCKPGEEEQEPHWKSEPF